MDLNILKHSLFSSLGTLNISVCKIHFQSLSLLLNRFYLFFLINFFLPLHLLCLLGILVFISEVAFSFDLVISWFLSTHLSLLMLFYFILSWVIFLMPLTSFWHGVLSITYPLEGGVVQGSFCRLKNSYLQLCSHGPQKYDLLFPQNFLHLFPSTPSLPFLSCPLFPRVWFYSLSFLLGEGLCSGREP